MMSRPIGRLKAAALVVLFGSALGIEIQEPSWEGGAHGLSITLVGNAVAEDDDDDGSARQRTRRRTPPRARRPTPRPELIVSAPTVADMNRISGLGYAITARHVLSATGAEIARILPPGGLTLAQARAQITTQIPGALIDVNHLYRPEEFTCGADGCRAFDMIGWSPQSQCGQAPTIGMVDTRVDVDHPALASRKIETTRALGRDRRASSSAHGTAVAALLVGDPNSATPGLLPNARLIAVEAFHRDASGASVGDAFDITRAIDMLADRDATTINLSFSGLGNIVLAQTIWSVADQGKALIAAAGNGGPQSAPLYPGAYDPVIAVTAVDRNTRIYRQANRGSYISFAAPGVGLWTAASSGTGRPRSGTSYAAPFVTAALARARQDAPATSVPEMVRGLASRAIDLGEPGRDPVFGWGLLQMPNTCLPSSG
jgi:hypothetical protein